MSWVCLSLDPIGGVFANGKPESWYLAFVLNFTSVSSNANPSAKSLFGYGFLDGLGGPRNGALTGASEPCGDGCGSLKRASSGVPFGALKRNSALSGASEPNSAFGGASFHDGP